MPIVLEHVQFCKKNDKSLRLFSEHSLENSQHHLKPFWEKSYKVAMNHPNYGEKMLESVHMYNALHI